MSEETPAAERWDVPPIDGEQGAGYMTAARLEALQREAWDEAYARGREEGIEAGRAEVAARAERLDGLLRALTRPFDELDETVEQQLVELAMAVVKQLFRREIRVEPRHVIGVVREAIKVLPVASRNVQVHLHPDDAALVRETLAPAEGDPAWAIVEDPLSSRGGCTVTTDDSRVDATVEARLHAVISAVLGDERR